MEPARKPRPPLFIGLLLIAAGITLLVLFTRDPKGALPGMPNAWKGGPMLLGAGFCSIVGAFLIVQRRFSLAGFLVGGLVSGALAAGANEYVRSFRDVRQERISILVPTSAQPLFIKLVMERVTERRLTEVLYALHNSGMLSTPPDFDGIKINMGASSLDTRELAITLEYEYSPYLHLGRPSVRDISSDYARTAIAISFEETAGAKGFKLGTRQWSGGSTGIQTVKLMCSTSHWFYIRRVPYKRVAQLDWLIKMLDVVIENEKDATVKVAMKEAQQQYRKELKNLPAIPP